MSKIWDRLNVSGGELLLALALADHGNDQGESIWPGVETLMSMTRQSRSTVQRQLAHLREIGWLEVVSEGGLAGGRGRSTVYRINADWIKGLNLRQLPDVAFADGDAEKGPNNSVNLTPFPDKGPDLRQERARSTTEKGLTAMRQDPSLTVRNLRSADARANPAGSRAAQEGPAQAYDAEARRRHWRCIVGGYVLTECVALGIAKYGTRRFEDLPTNVRMLMPDKIEQLAAWAIDQEREPALKPYRIIDRHLQQEITTELRAFRPATFADQAAAGEA